jgi:hypothetical protein
MYRIGGFARVGVATMSALVLFGCNSDSNSTGPAFTCTAGTPVVVDYTAMGTFQADTVHAGGVVVTGSNTVNVLNLNGLGIVGGTSDNIVDGSEWIRFDFDSTPVDSVSYYVPSAGNGNGDGTVGDATVEAYDRTGTSLGTMPVTSVGVKDVSGMFGGKPLSAFVVTAEVDNFRVGRVTYSACQ